MFVPDRFEGNKGEVQEVVPQAPPTGFELRAREQKLKARYEDPYRKEQAKQLWDERKEIRKKEEVKIQQLASALIGEEEGALAGSAYEQRPYQDANVQLSAEMEKFAARKEEIKSERENRSFLEKIKYRISKDPLKQEEESLEAAKNAREEAMQKNAQAIQEIEATWGSRLTETQELLQSRKDEEKERGVRRRKSLLEKTHKINQGSREAVRNTFLSMEEGKLDIAKLAKEANAVVVHGIPLDGWAVANTAMNNNEVDIKNLTPKEKSTILLEKQPDVSASILSVDRISGQDMFYPFAYILGGAMVAAYDRDEGTVADGDARRRKEGDLHQTLQKNVQEEFERVAHSSAFRRGSSQHNEAIVHKPQLKGVLLDEDRIINESGYYPGDEVREVFSSREEEEKKMAIYKAQYGDSIISSSQEIRQDLGGEPKNLFVQRKRTGMQKAIEYAQEQHPELPIYIRKADSIYTLDGKKVTAEDIYGK